MKRRSFFGAFATALAAPVVSQCVYSFLWGNSLRTVADIFVIDENENIDIIPGIKPNETRTVLQLYWGISDVLDEPGFLHIQGARRVTNYIIELPGFDLTDRAAAHLTNGSIITKNDVWG